MGHGMENGRDALVSGRKGSVWHASQTETTIVDERLTVAQAAQIGWARRDGEPGHWNPRLIRAYADAGDGNFVAIPDSFHVARDDFGLDNPLRFISTGRGVSGSFCLIDNDYIVEQMEALTQGGAVVETCGSIFGGARVYMSALLVGADALINDDQVALYLIVTTAHDGTAKLQWLISTTRVVCRNTLALAKRDADVNVRISHRSNAIERLAEAHEIIDAAGRAFGSTVEVMRRLAAVKLSRDNARLYLERLIGDTKRAEKQRERVMNLFNGEQIGADREAVNGTVYGMYSAVTEYIETDATVRVHEDARTGEKKDEFDVRFNNVMLGAGARKRDEALKLALAFADTQ